MLNEDRFFSLLVDFPRDGFDPVREYRQVWHAEIAALREMDLSHEGLPLSRKYTYWLERTIHDGALSVYAVLVQTYLEFASNLRADAATIIGSAIRSVFADAKEIWKDCVNGKPVEWPGQKIVQGSEEEYWDAMQILKNALEAEGAKHELALRVRMPFCKAPKTGAADTRKSPRPRSARTPKYTKIDSGLRDIAESRPKSQRWIFQQLDLRGIPIPTAHPFVGARGWERGFGLDPHAARAWLSKRWASLRLASLPPGPKRKLQ
jgi:hypothetical protein